MRAGQAQQAAVAAALQQVGQESWVSVIASASKFEHNCMGARRCSECRQ